MPHNLRESVYIIEGNWSAPLSQLIQQRYNALVHEALTIPESMRTEKVLSFSSHMVCVNEIIAYQIGWGKLLVGWYETGMSGNNPTMPGEGFTTWDYKGLAEHFYKKYSFPSAAEQHLEFKRMVLSIIEMVEKEFKKDNLEKEGVWPWCTLR